MEINWYIFLEIFCSVAEMPGSFYSFIWIQGYFFHLQNCHSEKQGSFKSPYGLFLKLFSSSSAMTQPYAMTL